MHLPGERGSRRRLHQGRSKPRSNRFQSGRGNAQRGTGHDHPRCPHDLDEDDRVYEPECNRTGDGRDSGYYGAGAHHRDATLASGFIRYEQRIGHDYNYRRAAAKYSGELEQLQFDWLALSQWRGLETRGPNGTGADFGDFGGPSGASAVLLTPLGSTEHFLQPADPIDDPLSGVSLPSVPATSAPAPVELADGAYGCPSHHLSLAYSTFLAPIPATSTFRTIQQSLPRASTI